MKGLVTTFSPFLRRWQTGLVARKGIAQPILGSHSTFVQLLHQKINVCVYFLSKYISQKFAKVKPKRLLFWKPFTSSFQKCLSFLDFLRYCTMGKARAFRKGLFNRSYGAFSFGKNFLLSTFILVLLKALWKLLLSQYTTIYYRDPTDNAPFRQTFAPPLALKIGNQS